MSITYPTFADKEIVSPEKLNNFVQAIEAKFSAGLGTAEIQWPLLAGGNLQMGTYEITGARKIFKLVNANEYTTLQQAVTAAGNGGVVFIPPDTTISTDGVTLVGSDVAIIGAGPSSVIKYTAAPSGPMIQNDSTNVTGFMFANLTLDGNSNAGSEKDGIYLKYVHDVIIHNVWFQNFSGDAVHLTNSGSAGNSPRRILISNCHFTAGSSAEKCIFADDVRDLVIRGCVFNAADEEAIYLVPASSSAFIAQVIIGDNIFYNGDTTSIYVAGSGAADSKHAYIQIHDNVIENQDGDPAIVAGTTGNPLQNSQVSNNIVADNHGGDGIECCIEKGKVQGNQLHDMAADAVDIKASKYLIVSGNHCVSATNVGVRATDYGTCVIHDNFVIDCATGIMRSATSRAYANEGAFGVPPYSAFYTEGRTVTIPANSLRVGDIVKVYTGQRASAGTGALSITFNGTEVAGTYSGSSTGNRVCYGIGCVISSSTMQWTGFGLVDDREVETKLIGVNVTLTTAMSVIAGNTGLTTADYNGLWVTLAGAEVQ